MLLGSLRTPRRIRARLGKHVGQPGGGCHDTAVDLDCGRESELGNGILDMRGRFFGFGPGVTWRQRNDPHRPVRVTREKVSGTFYEI